VLAAVINTESATFPLEKEKRSSEFPSMAYMRRKRKKGQTKKETEKLDDTIFGEFDKPCNISDNVTCCSCNQKKKYIYIYIKGNEN
jgi:hypothetical protein